MSSIKPRTSITSINQSTRKKSNQTTLDKFHIKIPNIESSIYPKMPKKGKINIISWNVNGIRALVSKNELENFINNGKIIFIYGNLKI
jgi:hypothetical protein